MRRLWQSDPFRNLEAGLLRLASALALAVFLFNPADWLTKTPFLAVALVLYLVSLEDEHG